MPFYRFFYNRRLYSKLQLPTSNNNFIVGGETLIIYLNGTPFRTPWSHICPTEKRFFYTEVTASSITRLGKATCCFKETVRTQGNVLSKRYSWWCLAMAQRTPTCLVPAAQRQHSSSCLNWNCRPTHANLAGPTN